MKLISMVDFVLQQDEITTSTSLPKFYGAVSNYAEFLNQPLTLGMFVPCDEKGNVLNETNVYHKDRPLNEVEAEYFYNIKTEQYQQAKERILFENNTEFHATILIDILSIVEDLVDMDFTLTKSAIKQIGL